LRIQRLHIGRYGHFRDVELPLEGDGVQMIVGPNEAGKSTLLEFVRELLFGFAVRTPYAFAATTKSPVQGSATLTLKDGSRVELSRRKGNKNTVSAVVEGRDSPLGEEGFTALLGHASANLFRSIFAFGLGELAEGEKMLDDQSVKSVLFGGGDAGAANPKKVIEALDAEAGKLFAEKAKVLVINRLCSELADLPKQVRQKSLRCDAYERSRKELEDAEAEAAEAADELLKASRDLDLKQKLASAFPRWVELDRLRTERAELVAPPDFPAGGLARFDGFEAEIDRLEKERAKERGDAETAEREAAEVQFDARLIDRRAAIEGLIQAIGSVKQARERLPIDERKRDESTRRATEQLASLVPEWSLDDLRAHRPTAARKAEFQSLAKRRADRQTALGDLLKKRDGHLETLRDKEAELRALGDPVDIAPLAAILADESDHKNNVNELKRLDQAARKTKRAIADLLPRLNPPLASPSLDAASLPVPPREAVVRAKRELDQIDRQIDTSETNIQKDETALDQLGAELAAMEVRGDDLPSREALETLRLARDEGWNLVRRKFAEHEDAEAEIRDWLAANAPEAPRDLLEVYPSVVRETDNYADDLLNQARAVAKHGQIQAARERLQRDRRALDDLRALRESVTETWRSLWTGCGLVPLDPDAMEGWLDRLDSLRTLRAEAEEHEQERVAIRERVEAFEARLRDLMGEPAGDAAKLLAAVRDREQTIRSIEQSRRDLQRDCLRLREKADEAEAQRLNLQDVEPAWTEAWRALLLTLRLPTDWDVDLVDRILRDLDGARAELEKADAAEADIAASRARLADFEPRVREIADELAPDLIDEAPEHAAAILQTRLTESIQARERKASLEKSLAAACKRIADLDAKLAAAREARAGLLEAAGADSAEAFRAIAERVERVGQLDKRIDDKKREFEIIRGREPFDEFVARLESADQALLDAQRDEAEARENEIRKRKTAADQNVGSRREAFKEYQKGSDEAALLQEQIAAKRAELAAGVDRYVPLVFARTLLKQAIQRFEQDSQPEVLRETSRIFQTMTDGRFTRVDRPTDDDGQLQVHRADGEILEPNQLSTGTREQLYLAVRLAYVLHYCGRAEPLPIVMDDVMANFDDERARHTLRALGEVSKDVQVIMFTCHPHFIEIGREVFPGLRPVEIPGAAVVEGV